MVERGGSLAWPSRRRSRRRPRSQKATSRRRRLRSSASAGATAPRAMAVRRQTRAHARPPGRRALARERLARQIRAVVGTMACPYRAWSAVAAAASLSSLVVVVAACLGQAAVAAQSPTLRAWELSVDRPPRLAAGERARAICRRGVPAAPARTRRGVGTPGRAPAPRRTSGPLPPLDFYCIPG